MVALQTLTLPVGVRIPIPQPIRNNPNTILQIGKVFGFFFYIDEVL